VQRQFTDIRISAEQYAGGLRGRLRRFRAHGEPDAVPGSGRGLYQCSGLSFELDLIAQRDPVGAR
jgi:hypothetical protein